MGALMSDGVELPWKDQVCNLGVLLALMLMLDKQMPVVAKSAFYQLHLVGQL